MFRSKTVFVLGAGASAEIGLPLGAKLLQSICSLIDIRYDHFNQSQGDRMITEAVKLILNEGREVDKYNAHLESAWQILKSSQQALSIDNIVDALEDEKVELMAKLGIVRAIHLAEEKSKVFPEKPLQRLNFSRFSTTWYDQFTKLICEGRRRSGIERVFENISIISFNYDRCLEAYLPRSIANHYNVEVSEVLPQFREIPFLRPYGIAGEIKWNNDGSFNGFGGLNAKYLAESSGKIRTFSELSVDSASTKRIQKCLSEARRIIFLGSAFHRQNLEVLKTDTDPKVSVLCTAKGIADRVLPVVRLEISGTFSTNVERIELANLHCNEFFEDYGRILTS